jgi:glycosyltransferase involved in cell wall biosynthesis
MSKVSIIVPVYNTERYLDNCIQSLIKQTYSNIEVVLVNDGSKDKSLEIIESWEKKDSRIIYIDQKNLGVTQARKNGVNVASGEWITFVDADDILPDRAIELMMNKSEGFDLVIGHIQTNLNWSFPRINTVLSQKEYMHCLLYRGFIHWGPVAKLFRKKIIDETMFDIPRNVVSGEDFIFNIRYAAKSKSIKVIEQDVYQYIWREGSATSFNPYKSIRYCLLYEKEVWKSFKGIRIKYFYAYCWRALKTIRRYFKFIVLKKK